MAAAKRYDGLDRRDDDDDEREAVNDDEEKPLTTSVEYDGDI